MGPLYRKIKKMIFELPHVDYLTKQNWASALVVLKEEELEQFEGELEAAILKAAAPEQQIGQNKAKIAALEKFQKEKLNPIFKAEEEASEKEEEALEDNIDQLLDEV